jgi:hypothetical protein
LFIKPVSIRKLLIYIFNLPVPEKMEELVRKKLAPISWQASEILRSKPKSYWFGAAFTTF